jgi:hypothetical protein
VEQQFNDRLAIVAQFQTAGIRGNITEENIYNFSQDTLGAQFVVWNQHFYSKHGGKRDNYIEDYVLPCVDKFKGKTVGQKEGEPGYLPGTNGETN